MKKFIVSLLLFSLFGGICFAAQEMPVRIDVANVPLKSSLKTKYSAYKVEFTNVSESNLKINEIKCYNKINIADPSVMENYNIKKTAICSALALPTLGLSLLFLVPDQVKTTSNTYSALNEQSKYIPINQAVYNLQNGNTLNVANAILIPGQCARYDLLVPLNEQPQLSASFQNMKTYGFINLEK